MSGVKRSLITINSQHRTSLSDSTSKFRVDLGHQIETENVLTCQVKNISFVNTAYNIDSLNNVFVINDGAYKTVTLEPGQYDLATVLSELTTALLAVGITIVLSIDPINKKVNVDSCIPACDFFDIQGSNINRLGITLGIIGSSGLVGSYQFTDLADISGLYQVNVNSRTLIEGSSVENITDITTVGIIRRPTMSDIIKTVPVNVPFGFQMVYENNDPSDFIEYQSPRNLTHIDVELRDVNNRVIDFHGTHVAITFLVTHLG